MALNVVSLLLTKHSPAAQTTMSALLKQALPQGVLGAEIVQAPQVSELEKHNDEMVGIGSRMKSLNGTADSLLKSASRLEEEMGRETTYWEQVLAVKEKGWSLHRMPREKHTLAVRYGFAECTLRFRGEIGTLLTIYTAHSDFRERGLAALRRDEDGNLNLDRGFRSKGDRKLRVRILEQGKLIASNIGPAGFTTQDQSVEKEILNARNSIFDEELHHELDREARNLVNQGVRCIDGSILLPYENKKQIEISLVPQDEAYDDFESSDPSPEAITIAFRILLSHAHRQNLHNRSKMPPPLRENKAPRPIYALIKPVLEYLQHQSHVKSTQALLDKIIRTSTAAGVVTSMQQPASLPDLRLLLQNRIQTDNSVVDDLLRGLTSPLHTTWTLVFPNEPTTITIEIQTAIHPPHFGPTFHVSISGSALEQTISTLPQPEQTTTTTTFHSQILDVVTVALQQTVHSNLSEWQIASVHGHTMVRKRSDDRSKDTVALRLGSERLDLFWRAGADDERGRWSWYGDEADGEGASSHLIDLLRQVGK